MLFPLMIGVGAGVALERYYLAKRRSKTFWEKMKKDAEKKQTVEDEAKDGKTAESIMDYINKAKKSHPQVVPRREAAALLMMLRIRCCRIVRLLSV